MRLENSDSGNQDIHVVQEVLKEIAQTQQVDLNAKKRFKGVVLSIS
jgi:replication factor C subunit 3/5